MAKQITGFIKMKINANKANPSPPVGPALGQRGLNLMQFCKEFNHRTKDYKDDIPIPVVITVYEDNSFTFITKTPPVSYFLKQALKLQKASSLPGKEIVGSIDTKQIYEIAKIKQVDPYLNTVSLQSLCKTIIGTAKSMGIKITK